MPATSLYLYNVNLFSYGKNIHQGKNVKRFREMFMIKQETMAHELGEDWTQKKVSLLEGKEVIEDGLLEQVAKILKVPVEVIKNFDEDQAITNIIHFTTIVLLISDVQSTQLINGSRA